MEEVLFKGKSEFQDIVVYKSESYGTVLILDGVIQLTDRDWFSYQEMISHVGMLCHPNPENICVIGGGDGAVISELCKYKNVKNITLCEIDQLVCKISEQFFPQFKAWTDPRLKFQFRDGFKFLEESTNQFDLIIIDSSDPVGPAESLFSNAFLELAKKALKPGGIVVQQAENIWLHLDIIKKMVSDSTKLFAATDYFYTTIPTYPSGQIGFLITSTEQRDFRKPVHKVAEMFKPEAAQSLQYYTEDVHSASFILPAFAASVLKLPHKNT